MTHDPEAAVGHSVAVFGAYGAAGTVLNLRILESAQSQTSRQVSRRDAPALAEASAASGTDVWYGRVV